MRDVYVGGAGKFLSVAERINPALVDWHMQRNGFDNQKTDWPKAEAAENNIGASVEFDGGVHGDFTLEAKHRSPYQKIETSRAAKAAIFACFALSLGIVLRQQFYGRRV
jgi:hypothetical protein